MALRSFLYISTGTLRIVLSIILVGILAFFALTRTQVGRDGLRVQLTQQFAARFDGTLEIDRLDGNLVNDLFASGVRLYDPEGRLVLSVDSVVARPRWRDVLSRAIGVGRLTLHRPTVHLIKGDDGEWSLMRAIRSEATGESAARPWSFTGVSMSVIDAKITTRNPGQLPGVVERQVLFDYTNAMISGLDVRANIEWSRAGRVVEVTAGSASHSSLGLALQILRGQLVLDDDDVELNQFEVRLGESRVAASARLAGLNALGSGELSSVEIGAELHGASLNHEEVRRILPSFPLHHGIQVSSRVHGTLDSLVVEQLQLASGASIVRLGGTLVGLPTRADFDLTIEESRVDVRDVMMVAPFLDLARYSHISPVDLSAHTEGLLVREADGAWIPQQVVGDLNLNSTAGAGTARLRIGRGEIKRFAYEVDVYTEGLDLGLIARDRRLVSRINGRLTASIEADAPDQVAGAVSVRLGPSSVSGHPLDSLSADFIVDDRRLTGALAARQNRGVVNAHLDLSLNAIPEFRVDAGFRHVDAGQFVVNDSLYTDLTGDLSIAGYGRSWHDFRGSIALILDRSYLGRGAERTLLAPLQTRINLADGQSGGTVLSVTGDVIEAEVTSTAEPHEVVHAISTSGGSLLAFIEHEYLKPYRPTGPTRAQAAEISTRDTTKSQHSVETSNSLLHRVGAQPIRLSGRVRVRNAHALSMAVPQLPRVETDLSARFVYRADSSSSELTATLVADSISTDQLIVRDLNANVDLFGRLTPANHEPWSISLDGRSRLVTLGDEHLREASLSIASDRGGGSLRFAWGDSLHGELSLDAVLRSMPDRNRLTITEFRYSTGSYTWINAERDVLDVYKDAVVAHGLSFLSTDTTRAATQRIEINGPFSRSAGDTLTIAAENLALSQLAQVAMGGAPLGGRLSGQLALTGGLRQPELTGNLDVSQLFFDNRLLGDLEVRSRYLPGMPDVDLEVRLSPTTSEVPEFPPAGFGPVVVEENNLTIRGHVRLPQFDDVRKVMQPSVLDLTLTAERADAFFFEYLFGEISSVEGYLTGVGLIGGTLGNPQFDGSFLLREAGFRVPDYNLAFSAEAEARIDQRGIHIDEGRLVDKTGGGGTISGSILFNDYRYFSFDLSGRLADVQIMDVMSSRDLAFYGRIWASGNVTLRGPLQNATLQSSDVVTHAKSEVFIPLNESAESSDAGFIVFADSSGAIPDFRALSRRSSIIGGRPVGERAFVDGLEMDLNIFAPPGSTVHLVIDPLLGDVINAVSSGRIHLLRTEGEYYTYGALDISSGDYLFTAGDVFVRRFLIDEGTLRWDGDPTDAELDVSASFRTRASTAGLPGFSGDAESASLIPLVVKLNIVGRVSTPVVNLRLALERRDRDVVGQRLEAVLNDPERSTQYATSVLLTNTFLLTTDQFTESEQGFGGTSNQLAFNSVSQLVANQINRYLSQALPNVDVSFGFQGERAQDLDVTYGVALRLLDERLIIRGEGVYQNDQQNAARGEFVVQVRLTPTVSVEVFYRREGDVLSDQTLTNTTGAGVSYQTRFPSWQRLMRRLLGLPTKSEQEEEPPEISEVAADAP